MRRFLKRGAWLGAIVALIALACTGSTGSVEPTSTTTTASAEATGEATGDGSLDEPGVAHLEITGQQQASIDLLLEGDPLIDPPVQFLVNYSNEDGQMLTLLSPGEAGTHSDVTVQMQINEGLPGFSHNAFGRECEVIVDDITESEVSGSFTCDFEDIDAGGTFTAQDLDT